MTAYVKAIATNHNKHNLAWHKLDANTESITDSDNVTTAMGKANNMDKIKVGKFPTYIHIGEHRILADSQQLAMTNCHWTDDGIQLLDRSVSWYEPIDNSQYAEILDPLTNEYPVAGVLQAGKYGEVLAIQLEMPEYTIGGLEEELHKPFLLVSENRKTGLKIFGSCHTRVVCMNTYNAAISEKGDDKSLPNSQDGYAILQFRTRIEQKAIENQKRYVDGLNYLFTKKVNNNDIADLMTKLFPEPKKPQMVKLWEQNQDVLNGDNISETVDSRGKRALQLYENAIDRNKKYERELVENFFKFNDEHSYAADTAYALFQATTEFYNHSDSWQSDEDTHSYNLMFGDKAKQMSTAFAVLAK